MIFLTFGLYWPYKKERKQIDYVERTWRLSKNKSLDLQVSSWATYYTVIDFSFKWTIRRSHAGIELDFGLFNYCVCINLYDSRHWNYSEGRWEEYPQVTPP